MLESSIRITNTYTSFIKTTTTHLPGSLLLNYWNEGCTETIPEPNLHSFLMQGKGDVLTAEGIRSLVLPPPSYASRDTEEQKHPSHTSGGEQKHLSLAEPVITPNV